MTIGENKGKRIEKIAIIDLGANTARLVCVSVMEGGYFMVFDELVEQVRLGQDMETDKVLRPARIMQTVKTLKLFKKFCDAYGIVKIMAYATSAVRCAKNQKGFLEEVFVQTGIRLKVLTDIEEATFTYYGVINSMDIARAVIMDIGGGSTQLIYYNRKNVLQMETLNFGSVTLTDKFKGLELKPEERAIKIEEFVKESMQEITWIRELEEDVQFIGVGGSFRNLGKISRKLKKYPIDMIHNYNIPIEEVNTIYDTMKTFDLDRTKKIKGLSIGRADIFPSALAAIKTVAEIANFKNVVISANGLREGAMFSYAMPSVVERPISGVLEYSLYTLVNFFSDNVEHAKKVYDLSIQLFRQLKVLHRLIPRQYLKVLRTASMLHDIGTAVRFYGHPKHSWYMIMNSNLYGISHKDVIMSAFVASAHDTGEPLVDELPRYSRLLSEEDIDAIYKLSVILKIAESFDRSMSGNIQTITCDVLGDSVIMQMETNGSDISLEVKDAKLCSPTFKRIFKKNLDILCDNN